MYKENEVMISIAMPTYNHERYISKAIDSILMQEVSFNIEIVIADDSSTDNTQKIIKKYANKYPYKIKYIFREKNIGARANITDLKKRCSGKYLIILEGDDYWTDSKKLQKQVEFLESNEDYIAVAHWCDVVDEENNISTKYINSDEVFNFKGNQYTLEDYKKDKIPGHINTILYRNIYLEYKYDYDRFYSASNTIGDRTTYLMLLLLGKVAVINQNMSAYRYVQKVGGSNYCSTIIGKNLTLEMYNYYKCLETQAKEVFHRDIDLSELKYDMFIASFIKVLKTPNLENKSIATSIFNDLDTRKRAKNTFKALLRELKSRLQMRGIK